MGKRIGLDAAAQEKVMREERVRLELAFHKLRQVAEREGASFGHLWLMYLLRRQEELECQLSELTAWAQRAVDAAEKAVEAEKP